MTIQLMDPKLEQEDLLLGLKRRNHKRTTSTLPVLDKLVSKDIDYGFALPTSLDSAKTVKNGR